MIYYTRRWRDLFRKRYWVGWLSYPTEGPFRTKDEAIVYCAPRID